MCAQSVHSLDTMQHHCTENRGGGCRWLNTFTWMWHVINECLLLGLFLWTVLSVHHVKADINGHATAIHESPANMSSFFILPYFILHQTSGTTLFKYVSLFSAGKARVKKLLSSDRFRRLLNTWCVFNELEICHCFSSIKEHSMSICLWDVCPP